MLNKIILSIIIILYLFYIKPTEYFINRNTEEETNYEEEIMINNIYNNSIKVNILVYKSPNILDVLQNKKLYSKNNYERKYNHILNKLNKDVFKTELFEINNVEYMYGDNDTENKFLNLSYGLSNNKKINDFINNNEFNSIKFKNSIINYNKNYIFYEKYLNNLVINSKIGEEKISWEKYLLNNNNKILNIIIFGNYNKLINKDTLYTYHKDKNNNNLMNPKCLYVTSNEPNIYNICRNLGMTFGLDLIDCKDEYNFMCKGDINRKYININENQTKLIELIVNDDEIVYPFKYNSSRFLLSYLN
tara:strand:- start:960 stop:1871 length:912 start_codon:yes stop_codon:yes gene_type:complete